MGIRRLNPPHDLDAHLMEVFAKQEDERYKMKLRHQVERVRHSMNTVLRIIDDVLLFRLG